MTTKDKKGSKQ